MIIPAYHVAASSISGAGRGLFIDAAVAAGSVLVAPDAIPRTYRWHEVLAQPDPDAALAASVRWFEDHYTVTLDWPDECYINHSFSPNGLWHLGFVFAARAMQPGEELTVDYRHLLGEGQREAFADSLTGEAIIGFSWEQSLQQSTTALARLLGASGSPPC
jgi:hypothetical protein